MKLKRHTIEVFSMSFLDCICCGFGAMILILVLTETGQPVVLEKVRTDMHGQVAKLQAELYEIRGETDVLNRDLKGRIEQLSAEKSKLAKLQGDLSTVKGQYQTSQKESEVENAEEGQLVVAHQKLTEEMERLLKAGYRRPKTAAVGGIPVDSEYIIFVVDTSGSMQDMNWSAAAAVMNEILNMYPRVKGIQVMDDEGAYMFDGYRGQWIADTPARRKAIFDRFRTWTSFSNSNPMEGIIAAIRTFASRDHKVSLYYLGDDFPGDSIQAALDIVERINRASDGTPLVRIHAIGFPWPDRIPQRGSMQFTALMRALCERNGGTFVGMDLQEKKQTHRI